MSPQLKPFAERIIEHPTPHDVEAADRAFERLDALDPERAGFDAARLAAARSDTRLQPLLRATFANSPYLAALAAREPSLLADLSDRDPESMMRDILDGVGRAGLAETAAPAMSRALRRAKGRAALLIALADLGGVWPLEQVTGAITALADACVEAALCFLLRAEAARGRFVLPEGDARPTEGSGLFVLAMGKMGAGELNYSSDIDLIVLYEPDPARLGKGVEPWDIFPRLTRSLAQMLQERTADGYVFRTDLRLRPDPSSSPVALSVEAAILYYETMAQNWERAAMIKARAAAGDLAAGERFLAAIAPFIWRKHLDFAAISDIQSIKRQIHAHKGHGRIAVAGHDIKVGRGGIREIEFFAQTQQLISGGRDPRLRVPTTVGALHALVETGRIGAAVADELAAAYRFLRTVEHRLQMIEDAQTQRLPASDAGLLHVAHFCGFPDLAAFSDRLVATMRTVQDHYADLFADAPSLAGPGGNLVFTGTDPDPGTIETLQRLGFATPETAMEVVRRWHTGRFRATRTARARELLTDLVPAVLTAIGGTSAPDAALLNFDRFLGQLPSGVQFLSLLRSNPGLLRLLARIMGTAPSLAEALGRNVRMFDYLLEPGTVDLADPVTAGAHINRELSMAESYEDILNAVRRFANDRRFHIGVELLDGRLDVHGVGRALSLVAEMAITHLLPAAAAELARRHGRVGEAGMAVIALGRLGGRQLTFGSDLDLVFVYDDRGAERQSDGASELAIGPYFTRLSQRLISAITTLTQEGRLYEVDMRLRPSGNSGAVAVPLSAYAGYMRSDAWTWEIMAATRGRTIAGPPSLRQAVDDVLAEVVRRPHDIDDLRGQVASMRARIEKTHGTTDPWSVKQVRGGLVDLEFTVQFLMLAHGAAHPGIVTGNVGEAISRLTDAGLLAPETGTALADAHLVLQTVVGLLRLCHGGGFREEAASPDFQALLARLLGVGSLDAARVRLEEAQACVSGVYESIVGRADSADLNPTRRTE
ncbi:MAG: bifunctional [glutamine synthetase] adenylyltransferase/[glutamine synthetase]-adenylyl-L-tyrosine phosphorylase [Pseudomonadota bacterium]|nr:bifunctional [glutamine synthetase] adenylyltransferase/[glutamine synthetase]-adenylyl-L-tyrosine phosphorylase [Pseudomonadota bacterium]